MPGSGSLLQIIEHVASVIEPNFTNPIDSVGRLDLIFRKRVVILPLSFELLQVRFCFASHLRPNREFFSVWHQATSSCTTIRPPASGLPPDAQSAKEEARKSACASAPRQ